MLLILAVASAATASTVAPTFQETASGAAATTFQLVDGGSRTIDREQAAPSAPVLPANIDLRDFAVDAPEFTVPLSTNGLRLQVGAFGGRGKGMPKLAHVGIGWTF